MRLSSNQIFNQGVDSILDTQERLVKAQDRIAKQTKILTPSDDPAATAQVMRLNEKIELTKQYETNATILTNHLNREEVAINTIKDAMERAKVLTIQAGSGSLSDADRLGLNAEIRNIIDEVYDAMNTRNSNGDYIFAGFQSKTQPFVYNAATNVYDYQGDEGELKLQISSSVQLSAGDNGKKLFEDVDARLQTTNLAIIPAVGTPQITTSSQGAFDVFHNNNYDPVTPANNNYSVVMNAGNTYSVLNNGAPMAPPVGGPFDPDQGVNFQGMNIKAVGAALPTQVDFTLSTPSKKNILTTLNDLSQALIVPGGFTPAMNESLSDAMVQITNSAAQVAVVQSSIGGRLNVAESIMESNIEINHANQKTRADLAEIDYSTAVTDLMREESALEAAHATFGRVSNLSLFDFIR